MNGVALERYRDDWVKISRRKAKLELVDTDEVVVDDQYLVTVIDECMDKDRHVEIGDDYILGELSALSYYDDLEDYG